LSCAIDELGEINTLFCDIVELNNTSAISVKDSILQVLEKYGKPLLTTLYYEKKY